MSTASPTPEQLSDENNAAPLVAITVVFLVLFFIFAIMRTISMRIKQRSFDLDDFFSYVAFFLLLGECVLSFRESSMGFGICPAIKHVSTDLPVS